MSAVETVAVDVDGLSLRAPPGHRYEEVLSAPALAFVADLQRRFASQRERVLRLREERQRQFDAGDLPDFLDETRHVRDGDWQIATIPAELRDRRVEITGAPDRRTMIDALNSGARVFIADFEDGTSPTWANMVEGQVNLKDRWSGRLDVTDLETGTERRVGDAPAVLMMRPRGLHMDEAHIHVDGAAVCAALFDIGLYLFHNAKSSLTQGSGPYVYLPKLESHLEARLWNDVFVFAQETLGLANGTVKATAQVETLPAAFEMDEILYELREHAVALNCGRWDYVFSFVKVLRNNPDYLLPDRATLAMDEAFLGAASRLLVATAHRRGALAIGGVAGDMPSGDADADAEARAAVAADKEREARAGYDGAWVAHPDLVGVATEVFDRLVSGPNQIDSTEHDDPVSRDQLLTLPEGSITEAGLRENVRVGVRYLESWLSGHGAVPIDGRMEDGATSEIARAQLWQQLRHGATLDDGRTVTTELFLALLDDEIARLRDAVGSDAFARGRFQDAVQLFRDLTMDPGFKPYLTVEAYRRLV